MGLVFKVLLGAVAEFLWLGGFYFICLAVPCGPGHPMYLLFQKNAAAVYKLMVRSGRLKPMKQPGGDKFFKSQLLGELKESKRRGRV